MDTVCSVINSVTAAAVSGKLSEQLRVTLLEAATKLVAALQRPEDAITKLAYQVRSAFERISRFLLVLISILSLRSSWQLEPFLN